MEKMKMGILGSGGIAHTMANTVKQMADVELYAVGARTLEKAQSFAEEFGMPKAYGSYEELAGGALLDVGVYPLNFACMIDRTPVVKVTSDAVMNEYGVDSSNSITLTFADGATAMLHSFTLVISDRKGMIYGDQGYIEVENINNCQGFKVYDTHYQLVKEYPVPPQISGYEYEVEACKKAIEEGRSECPEMPHRESIRMMELMDTIRKEWGLRYPME